LGFGEGVDEDVVLGEEMVDIVLIITIFSSGN